MFVSLSSWMDVIVFLNRLNSLRLLNMLSTVPLTRRDCIKVYKFVPVRKQALRNLEPLSEQLVRQIRLVNPTVSIEHLERLWTTGIVNSNDFIYCNPYLTKLDKTVLELPTVWGHGYPASWTDVCRDARTRKWGFIDVMTLDTKLDYQVELTRFTFRMVLPSRELIIIHLLILGWL